VVLFQSVGTLSSVGTAILGNVKIVMLLFLSSLILGELNGWSANQYLGCVLTFAAAGFYSYIKATAPKTAPAPPAPAAPAPSLDQPRLEGPGHGFKKLADSA